MAAPNDRECRVYMAKLAEQAERYDEMTDYIKEVATMGEELSVEERNLLSVAFKNSVGARRASWRLVQSIEHKEKGKDEVKENLAKEFRHKIELELKDICDNIIKILDSHLLKSAVQNESKVFYFKMKGDYYRYISEFACSSEKNEPAMAAKEAYELATATAQANLASTHPIRLGLALNFSVFYYEILNQQEQACSMAQKHFDEAIAELDSVSEESYKDSTLIMQLLRDNLTLWSSESQNERATGSQEGEGGEV